MKKIILIFLLFGVFFINSVHAEGDLGVVKQEDCISLYQYCPTCTYTDLRAIKFPNGTIDSSLNIRMTKTNSNYNYTYCNTNDLGTYFYTVCGNKGGASVEGCEELSFEVTLNGNEKPEGVLIVIFIIIFILIFIFGILSFFNGLKHFVEFDMDLTDTILIMSSFLGMWMFYYFSVEYLGNSFINDILETMISVGIWTHIFLPLIAFLVSFIMINLKAKQKSRITY